MTHWPCQGSDSDSFFGLMGLAAGARRSSEKLRSEAAPTLKGPTEFRGDTRKQLLRRHV